MKRRRILLALTVATLVLAPVVGIWSQVHSYRVGKLRVMSCGSQFAPAMPASSAEAALASGACDGLERSSFDEGPKRIISMRSPLVFGAGNWILRLEIERDGVTAVKYHSEDSVNDHPPDAPPDR